MSDEQSLLLNHLKQFTSPTAFSTIAAGLETPDRTLRRWLSKLVEQGLIEASGERKGRRYHYAVHDLLISEDSAEYNTTTSPSNLSSVFSAVSQQVINQVRAPLYERRPCTYRYEWLESYRPNTTFYLNVEERNQLHEIGQRLNVGMPAGTYAKQIFNRLLIDLSYHSSRLEGNTYSLAETEKLLLQGMSADDKIDADKVMILNHKDAINFLVEGINRIQVSEENIRTMHYLLAEGLVPNGCAGIIRNDGVRITSSTYIPMEGQQRLEQQLQLIINKAAAINDPFEQSFFLLIHIAYLQAFIDVNKRTARLSANIPLVRNNLSPLSFIDLDKDDYASAMIACYELNNERPMVELFIRSYIRSCEQFLNYERGVVVDAMGIDTLRIRYRGQRRILISEIVRRLLVGTAIQKCIESFSKKEVSIEHREKFIADVQQDLENLEPFNIAGMGISKEELLSWMEYVHAADPPETLI